MITHSYLKFFAKLGMDLFTWLQTRMTETITSYIEKKQYRAAENNYQSSI